MPCVCLSPEKICIACKAGVCLESCAGMLHVLFCSQQGLKREKSRVSAFGLSFAVIVSNHVLAATADGQNSPRQAQPGWHFSFHIIS